jgi:hypothetical protein
MILFKKISPDIIASSSSEQKKKLETLASLYMYIVGASANPGLGLACLPIKNLACHSKRHR